MPAPLSISDPSTHLRNRRSVGVGVDPPRPFNTGAIADFNPRAWHA